MRAALGRLRGLDGSSHSTEMAQLMEQQARETEACTMRSLRASQSVLTWNCPNLNCKKRNPLQAEKCTICREPRPERLCLFCGEYNECFVQERGGNAPAIAASSISIRFKGHNKTQLCSDLHVEGKPVPSNQRRVDHPQESQSRSTPILKTQLFSGIVDSKKSDQLH